MTKFISLLGWGGMCRQHARVVEQRPVETEDFGASASITPRSLGVEVHLYAITLAVSTAAQGGLDTRRNAGQDRAMKPTGPLEVADHDLSERITRLIESRPQDIADPYPLYEDLLEHSPVHR